MFKRLVYVFVPLIFFMGSESRGSFDSVPNDLLTYMFKLSQVNSDGVAQPILSEAELCRCAKVSKAWRSASSADQVWESRMPKYFPFKRQLYIRYSAAADQIYEKSFYPAILPSSKEHQLKIYPMYKYFFLFKSIIFAEMRSPSLMADAWSLRRKNSDDLELLAASELYEDGRAVTAYISYLAHDATKSGAAPNTSLLVKNLEILIRLGSNTARQMLKEYMEIRVIEADALAAPV